MAALTAEHRSGTAPDGPTGVGGCEQKCHNRPDGQIVEVIAHKGRLRGANSQFVLKGREGRRLVLDADKAMADAQLPGTHLCRSSLATTEEGDMKPRLLKQADPKTIAHIEAFDQLPLGIEPEASIGEDAIHIQHEQFN